MSARAGIEPEDIIVGALAMLVSDATNGITPNDIRLYRALMACGVMPHEVEAEVKTLVAQLKQRARALADHGRPAP